MKPRVILALALCAASLLAAPAVGAAAVVVVPVPHTGSSPVAAEVQKVGGFIGKMVRLVRAPTAGQAKGAGVATGTVQFNNRETGDSTLGVAVKLSGTRAAFVIQPSRWVVLSSRQYAALTENLVIETRISWACEGKSGFNTTSARPERQLDPIVYGAPRGNLLPQGADADPVRLTIPPAAIGIPGPPAGCRHPAASVSMKLTADLPDNYPAGVPIGTPDLPLRGTTRLTLD